MAEHLKTKILKALVYRITSKPVYRDTHDKVCILFYRFLKQITVAEIIKAKLRTENLKEQPNVWKRGKQNLLFKKSFRNHDMSRFQNHFILENEEAGFCI